MLQQAYDAAQAAIAKATQVQVGLQEETALIQTLKTQLDADLQETANTFSDHFEELRKRQMLTLAQHEKRMLELLSNQSALINSNGEPNV